MKAKTRLAAILVAGTLMAAPLPPAFAQGVPVIDGSNLAQNIEQLQAALRDAENQLQQIEELRTQIDQAMTRIAALLREDPPDNAKEALDRSTYMLAERARLMALTLRLRAAHVKVEAAQGLTEAADHLEQSTFWRYSDEG